METRGVFGGGTPTNRDEIEYITIASTGNSNAFGDLTKIRDGAAGLSSPTRGIFAAGGTSPQILILMKHHQIT